MEFEAGLRPGASMRRSMVGGALVSALLVAAALITSTSTALTTKSDSKTLAPDESKSVTAKCGRGKRAMSGGFRNPGFDALSMTDPTIWTFVSRRTGRREITATGLNQGDVSGELIAYAYCGEGRLSTKLASTPMSFGDQASATAKCPRGSRVISGGFEMSPAESFPVLPLGSSREGRRKWTASGTQFGDSPTLTAFAYCQESGPRLVKKAGSTMLGHDEADSATAKCPRGSEAVSGGFFAPGGFSLSGGSEIYFYESRRVGERRWRAAGLNQGDPAQLTAYAYCK